MIAPEILAFAAVAIGLYATGIYIVSIIKGETKPHLFSWFIWGLLTAIAWAAQIHQNAGAGAWVTLTAALMCFVITVLCFRYGEKTITRSDWITFIAALCAIPLWFLTKDPLWSVILVTVIDMLGFYPTFRKSWLKPGEETLWTYGLSVVKFGLGMMALETFNVTTALYPFSLVVTNAAFVIFVIARRKIVYA